MQTGLINIFATIAPVFLIVCVGYGTVRSGLVSSDGVRAMAGFLVNVAVPALLFGAISGRDLGEVLDPRFLLVYGAGSLIAFLIVFMIATMLLRRRMTGAAIYGVGASLSNSLMVGFPIASAVLGPAALAPFAMVLLVENLFILPLTLVLADLGRNQDSGLARAVSRIAPSLLKNPVILAILLGVLVSQAGIKPPAMLEEAVGYLGRTVTGLGLFIVGGMLVGFRYSGNLRDVTVVVLAKLLLHPGAVLLLFLAMPGPAPEMAIAGVILAAAPMFGIYVAIAERYDLGAISAAALAPATVLSFFSMSLVILAASAIWAG